jgi:hypothetical protein
MNGWFVAAVLGVFLTGWMLGLALHASGIIVTCTGCR